MFQSMKWCYLLKKKANDKVYKFTNTVFKDYVANTVFNTAIPAYFGQKKCATSALRKIHHVQKVKSLIYIDKW